MPRSHGLVWLCAGWLVLSGVQIAAQEPARTSESKTITSSTSESLAATIRHQAKSHQFSKIESQLAELAQQSRTENLRFATVLYAAQEAYAAGERDQAQRWLRSIEREVPAPLRPAVEDALFWSQCDPNEQSRTTAQLLELTTQHARSSLAAAALVQRADWLVEQEHYDEALWIYQETSKRFPTTHFASQALFQAAKLHFDRDQAKETLACSDRFLREYAQAPEVAAVLYLQASAAAKLKDEAKSTAALELLVQDHPESPYWPDAACRLGERAWRASQLEQSQKLLSAATAHRHATSAQRARCWFVQSQIAFGQRDWATAESALEKVLSEQPEQSLRHLADYWLAEVSFQRGNVEKATSQFQELCSVTLPGDLAGMPPLRLAQLAARRQQWAIVLEQLDHLSPPFARQAEADFLRARALLGQAQFRDARKVLQAIVTDKAQAGTEQVAKAQWMIGESYFLQRQYEAALTAYDAVLTDDRFPQWQAASLLQSGKCCEQLARNQEAYERYDRLVTDFSQTPYASDAQQRLARRTEVKRPPTAVAEQPSAKPSTR